MNSQCERSYYFFQSCNFWWVAACLTSFTKQLCANEAIKTVRWWDFFTWNCVVKDNKIALYWW